MSPGLTQAQIAKRLGLNRIRVNRMLAQAREQGIVQVRINSKVADCVALEERLRERYGLQEAIVVPTPPDPALIPQTIAVAAGAALSARIDGRHVGRRRLGPDAAPEPANRSRCVRSPGLSVVSLLGGLTRGSALNVYEIASRLAELFSAECFYVAAPVFTDTEATRDLLIRQPILDDAFAHARKVDIAFVSVGALDLEATNFRLGLVNETRPRLASGRQGPSATSAPIGSTRTAGRSTIRSTGG